MEPEIWRVHPEYTGIEVSTFGRVRTLDRVISSENGTRSLKGRILKQYLKPNGYMQLGFSINGKHVTKLVHRLVAQTFLPNPDNLPQTNHKNCIRTNNNVENLEWCTSSYDAKYREKHGVSQAEKIGHPLFAINLSTLKISRFETQSEAGRTLGVNQANINAVIKGRQKTAYSFWFVNDDGHAVEVVKSKLHDIGKTGLKI